MSMFRLRNTNIFSISSLSAFYRNFTSNTLNVISTFTPHAEVGRRANHRLIKGVAFVSTSFQLKNSIISCSPSQQKIPQSYPFDTSPGQPLLIKRLTHNATMGSTKTSPPIAIRDLTKNLTLFTEKPNKIEFDAQTLAFKSPSGNPLVLLISWLLGKQKHLKKYAAIYTEMGFDVLVCHITPWQLLWPTKGTQLVAADTLKFLENNPSYAPIVVHGFSVGGYNFGEMLLIMSKDVKRYQPILDRISAQIWDSAADITEISVGLPAAIFPKNPRMQTALRSYVMYHLKTFHKQATIHYMRSSQMFHSTLLKAPALFFLSKNDSIGPPSSNRAVRENWERANIKVTYKCWDKSVHAAHFIHHRDEYLSLLLKHLEDTGILENLALKSRAKL